jgi:integrase
MAKKGKKRERRGKGDGGVYPLADGTWRGSVTIGYNAKTGKQYRKYVRGKTEPEVREKLRRLLPESSSRLVHAPEKVTVAEWLERYRKYRASKVRPSTRSNHKQYVSKIKTALGDANIHQLTAYHLRDFFDDLIKQKASPSVRQHIYHFLKSALLDAERMVEGFKSPMTAVDRPEGGSVTDPQVWESWEVLRFLETMKDHRLYGVFYFTLTQGLRIGEVLGLKWSDLKKDTLTIERTVTLDEGKITLGPPKTERGYRTLYLTEDALEVLRKRRNEQLMEKSIALQWSSDEHIFCTIVGTLTSINNVRRIYRQVLAGMIYYDLIWNIACYELKLFLLMKSRIGVSYIRIHDQRHTYTTTARDAGIDLEVLANRLGQDPRVTAATYSHITESRKRKAALSSDELYKVKKDDS